MSNTQAMRQQRAAERSRTSSTPRAAATRSKCEEASAATHVIPRDDIKRPEGADKSRSRPTSEVDREERAVVLSEEEGDDTPLTDRPVARQPSY